MVRKITNRTHRDVDFVTDASESEKTNVLNYCRDFPIALKLPLSQFFGYRNVLCWVSALGIL